jgi:very-short-patch-repair endonuclease
VRVSPARHVVGTAPRIHRLDGRSENGVDDVITALIVATACMQTEHAICALDSALQLGKVSVALAQSRLLGARGRRVVGLADGRSQSGIETLTRLRLRSLGIRLRVQVAVEGVGRVDILVGDRLVIELDGDAWHSTVEQRETDRRRDSALVALGYLVIRAGYWRVLTEWDGLEQEVLAIVRRDEHLWRNIHPGRVHDDWRNRRSSS